MTRRNQPLPQKRKRDLYLPIGLTVLDVAAVVAGLAFAYLIRFHSPVSRLPFVNQGHLPGDYVRLFPLALACWLAAFCLAHLYRRNEKIWSWPVAGRLAQATLLAAVLFVTIDFFTRPERANPLSRSIVPIVMLSVSSLVALERWALHRRVVARARHDGRGLAQALVLGVGPSAKEIARSMRRHPEYGWQIVGFLSDRSEDVGHYQTGIEVIGTLEDLPGLLDGAPIEAVFVAMPDLRHERLGGVFVECQKRMVDVKVMPDVTEMLFSRIEVEQVDGLPFMGVRETPLRGWMAVLKRAIDFVGAALLLLLFAPLMAAIAFLIRRDSKGPVFYNQERVGADGNRFAIRKFRTMRIDAEKWSGPVFSVPDDPRQTSIGRYLRQMHLDELPQLLNVLAGDMSLVGPRPERPFFVEQFREEIPRYMARHRIKSGMTGWAQVNGQTGHEGTVADRLRYDLFYIENWSPLFDLKVLLMTIGWIFQRAHQVATLPAGHPSLRKTEAPGPVEGEGEAASAPEPSNLPPQEEAARMAAAVQPDSWSQKTLQEDDFVSKTKE